MDKRRLNNWRRWLQTGSLGLLLVATFAPLPETLRGILLGVAFAGMSVYLVTDSSVSRKWLLSSMIPLAAFILLAVLFSFDRWLAFLGILGVWAGMTLCEFCAEYLAQRNRRQRLPESG